MILTGAGSGMGRACAGAFAAEGATLVLSDIDAHALAVVTTALRADGAAIAGEQAADVTDSQQVDALVRAANEAMGGIDAGVHWAGVVDPPRPVHQASIEDWDRVLAVNLDGAFYFARAVLPSLVESEGSLVLVSSVAGLTAWPSHPTYCASKGGVLLLARALGIEYAQTGARVNCLCPGSVDTPMLEQIIRDEHATRADLLTIEPSGRFGSPDELAQVALFLVSEAASYLNAATLTVDGGFTAS